MVDLGDGYDDEVEAFVQRMYWSVYGASSSAKLFHQPNSTSLLAAPGRIPRRKIAIVATLGPRHFGDPTSVAELFTVGVDVFRINFSHLSDKTAEVRGRLVKNLVVALRETYQGLFAPRFLGDLQGPKIRTSHIGDPTKNPDAKAELRPKDIFTLHVGRNEEDVQPGDAKNVWTPYPRLISDLQLKYESDWKGRRILLGDGEIELSITNVDSVARTITTSVVQGGKLGSRKGITIPGVTFTEKPLGKDDIQNLCICLDAGLDFIGLSFVRKAKDVIVARQIVEE